MGKRIIDKKIECSEKESDGEKVFNKLTSEETHSRQLIANSKCGVV